MARVERKHTTIINEKRDASSFSKPLGSLSVRLYVKKWLRIKSKSSNEDAQRNKIMNLENKFDICMMVKQSGSKYKYLFESLSRNVYNLLQGYRCLESFHKAEKTAKSKKERSCAKGYGISRVKFVIRNQFYGFKQLNDDIITPSRFASVLTLAADRLFQRRLIYDSAALLYAYQMIKNPFAHKHGFTVDKVPETVEEMKLFYYYLTTTIGVHALMETRPEICMAIAKWRFHGENPKRLELHSNVLDIDEVYASCLRVLWASSHETQISVSTRSCNPVDFINNKSLLRKILREFEFLKMHASIPQ